MRDTGEQRATVLVIDDEPIMRSFMCEVLRGAGCYDVHEAEDGDQGLALLRSIRCDVVVTDIFMPNREGIEFCTALREAHPDVRAIAVSGAADAELYFKILEYQGVRAALRKPFGAADLLETVRSVLHGPGGG